MANTNPIAVLITDSHLTEENCDIVAQIHQQADSLALQLNVPLIHMGDHFDERKFQRLPVLLQFSKIIRAIKSTMYTIPGNHDKVDYHSTKSYIDIYRDVYSNIHIFDQQKSIIVNPQLIFHFIPFFSEDQTYDTYLDKLIAEIEQQSDKSIVNLLFTHVAIGGARNNDGSAVVGVPSNRFKVFDAVYVGHYHNAQRFGNVQYVGSILQKDYGEDTDKGVLVLYDDLNCVRVPTTFPQYAIVEINVDTCPDVQAEIVKARETFKENLRIELTGTPEKIKSIDKSYGRSLGVDIKEKSVISIQSQLIQPITACVSNDQILTHWGEFSKINAVNQSLFVKGHKLLQDEFSNTNISH